VGHAASDSISTISDFMSAASDSLSFGVGWGEAVGLWDRGSRALFSLKTNLLLWAGVLPDFKHTTPVANAALEYYITDCWSVELGAMYSYWRYDSNREFQGISGYRLEPRYRFALPGDRFELYLGIYGRVGDYDLHKRKSVESSQLRVDSDDVARSIDNGQMTIDNDASRSQLSTVNSQLSTEQTRSQNDAQPNSQFSIFNSQFTGDYWDAGLSAGFTFRLVGGWGLEVGARAGYVSTKVIYYTPEGDYNWYKSEKKYNNVRVTDLNLSLIYCF
jgi:hypothetical protein